LKAHQVGTKQSNELGIFDMSGNVLEWCSDWGGASYSNISQSNPIGPIMGTYRIIRGGCFPLIAVYLRVSERFVAPPNYLSIYDDFFIGFRLALSAN